MREFYHGEIALGANLRVEYGSYGKKGGKEFIGFGVLGM